MLDVFDSETIVKVYRMLKKKCSAIDQFIENHALYYGPDSAEFNTFDVINNILDLMARKNQLINLKIIVDNAVNSLDVNVKKVLYIKMNYSVSMAELCGILDMKERTAFRWVERAFADLTEALNNSKYLDKIEAIIKQESWIKDVYEEVRQRRISLKMKTPSNLVSNL